MKVMETSEVQFLCPQVLQVHHKITPSHMPTSVLSTYRIYFDCFSSPYKFVRRYSVTLMVHFAAVVSLWSTRELRHLQPRHCSLSRAEDEVGVLAVTILQPLTS
jgi:hypothetical protein